MSMNAGQIAAIDRNTRPRLGSMHDELCRYDQTSEEEKLTMMRPANRQRAKPEDGPHQMRNSHEPLLLRPTCSHASVKECYDRATGNVRLIPDGGAFRSASCSKTSLIQPPEGAGTTSHAKRPQSL